MVPPPSAWVNLLVGIPDRKYPSLRGVGSFAFYSVAQPTGLLPTAQLIGVVVVDVVLQSIRIAQCLQNSRVADRRPRLRLGTYLGSHHCF